ncbi:N6-Methyl-AMP deaminase-like isoform X2 [Ptychodera flava]|uniref:N6-Methyl-AMP deaminase-like isoform X2 n=1 Tax=Ptychodera flava TaxID=63121 RepID=UPI00396A3BC3
MADTADAKTCLSHFCKKLPKTELHAHLNGSVSEKTIMNLVKLHSAKQQTNNNNFEHLLTTLKKGQERSLEETFQMFGIIHQLVNCTEAVAMSIRDVIQEFRDDNVLYLELRSTPRDVPATGMTKRSYIETVLAGIRQCEEDGLDIIVRFLLSIDRRVSLEVAMEIVKLAEEYKESSGGIVLGVDLSGDPAVDATKLIPALLKARDAGLKVAVHLAEVPKMPDDEALIRLQPDRAGHLTFLHPDVGGNQHLVSLVQEYQIPLELCLTSNVMCKTVPTYDNHHFKFWYDSQHPVTIATDDKGVFLTSLSKEYLIAADAFQLNREELWKLSYQSINFIFEDDNTKEKLREVWHQHRQALGL